MAKYIRLWRRLTGLLLISIFFAACDGSTGSAGADGATGATGSPGPEGPPGPVPDAIEAASVESCATCHSGVGDDHQATYDKYTDDTDLVMTFDNLTSVDNGDGTFATTLNFSITKNGQPLLSLGSLNQQRFYVTRYDSATGQYLQGNTRLRTFVAGAVAGDWVASQADVPFDPTLNGQVYGYIADEEIFPGDIVPGKHINLYDNVASAALAFGAAVDGAAGAYTSAANVEGCETCHGTPYMKHGFRDPIVAPLPDFASCKSCHYDDRTGGHEDWQYMVDDPLNWATAGLPETEVETKYAYKAKLMNDVHMAHAMEFPYPQSMANCATCHEGKLDQVLANTNFTPETCLSCHPVNGTDAWPELGVEGEPGYQDEGAYYQSHRAPALEYLWTRGPSDLTYHIPIIENPTLDLTGTTCQECHGNGISRPFDELHTGYDVRIANDAGEKYRDLFTVSIDDISVAGDVLTISYSASDMAIEPHVYVSFYGWDSKQFIVPSHMRDDSVGCSGGSRGCRFEYAPGDTNPSVPELHRSRTRQLCAYCRHVGLPGARDR